MGLPSCRFTRKALLTEMNPHGPNQLGIRSRTKKEEMPDNKPLPGCMLQYFRNLLKGYGSVPPFSIPLTSWLEIS